MKKIATLQRRDGHATRPAALGRGAATAADVGMRASVIVLAIMAASLGGAAAADDATVAKPLDTKTISLAGRWSGPHDGYGRQGEQTDCAGEGCTLTYDIVACKEGWCGIAVKDGKTCGPIGIRLAADDAKGNGDMAFKGKLELAKGSAAYTVEAWYRLDEGRQGLHFLGDTGPELLLMRRSFPFEADLTRAGDATCTLDKATS